MQIEIHIKPEQPDRSDRYALQLVVVTNGEILDSRVLQIGYPTPEAALEAFLACLTEPPQVDLSGCATTEELAQVAGRHDETGDVLLQLATRVAALEQKLAGGLLVPPSLDAGPPPTVPAVAARTPVPPPIRRPPMTVQRPEAEQHLASRVHSRPFGGPIRRGAPGVPGAPDGAEE